VVGAVVLLKPSLLTNLKCNRKNDSIERTYIAKTGVNIYR